MKSFFLYLFTFLAWAANAQNVEYIVFAKTAIELEAFVAENNLTEIRKVCKTLPVYLFITKPNSFAVKKQKNSSLLIQENMVSDQALRTAIPTDTYFDKQWQFLNSGTNGTAGADLGVLNAWQITKPGITAFGDTIAVGVIDFGFNLNHEDYRQNSWRNPAETNNGLDDDGNGFIDDVHGWNFKTKTNDITNNGIGHWHGTPINGIIGADTDNNLGVAGINKRIKIVNTVRGNDVLSVLQAYDYLLGLKKLYLDTNGKMGANIVAINLSSGIDFAKAADYPVWCAIYDVLGENGILSVASTANNNIDVDLYGDMPTTCSSEYLLSVTNTNWFGGKVNDAAYGAVSIDLGAPGYMSYTLANNGEYGYFNGTSAAAPFVTAAIGLLHSARINEFASDYKTNPMETTKRLKECILSGVVQVPELQQNSVSGGTLHCYNSLKELYRMYRANLPEPASASNFDVIQCYPNPSTNEINLILQTNKTLELNINLFSVQGVSLLKESVRLENYLVFNKQIDVSKLKTGVYFLHLQYENYIKHIKIIKD